MSESEQIAKKKKKTSIIESIGVVENVFRETDDSKTLRIKMPFLSVLERPFSFNPGQFVMVSSAI